MLKSKHYNKVKKPTYPSAFTHKAIEKISQEELELFRNTIDNSNSFKVFDKDSLSQDNAYNSRNSHNNTLKHNKFLNYRIITESNHSASDILFYNSGISAKIIKNMKQGRIAIDATIDLHGQIMEEACISLANFVYYHQNKSYLHIIHGKGYNANSMSKLKTQVNIYLQDHPQISAFCSTPPNFGGTGAIFAKLKH